MRTILLLALFACLILPVHAQETWGTGFATTSLGSYNYFSSGNLGYGVRTATGGGWGWQLVDGGATPYFHVEYPTGKVGMGTTAPGPYTKLNVVGGAVEISAGPHQADASLHISTSFGQFGRLTQLNPGGANMHALNLIAGIDAASTYNWWSWGVLNSGSWALKPSTDFNGGTGWLIDRNGNLGINHGTFTGHPQFGTIEFPRAQILFSNSNTQNQLYMSSNAYLDEMGSVWKYRNSGTAASIGVDNGAMFFLNAPSGSAGATVPFATTMIVSSDGVGVAHGPMAGYKLAVGGKTITEEVNVKLQANWPDYVFEKSYDLPTAEELTSYIEENKRLPEVPSAKEVQANGINLSEMNSLLLKKIEELTLYMLAQEKRIKVLEGAVDRDGKR